MIKRLDVKDYGKFPGNGWDFGPFTVVTGPNEAGKTTIFDALFDALCADSRKENLVPWKKLAGRYGALRQSSLCWDGDPLSFDFAEFLEIFAIRGGDTDINAADGGTWSAMAQAKLLSAGLNPAEIGEALAKKAKTRAAGGVQARISGLNDLIAIKIPELDTLKTARDRIFAGESETKRLEVELKAQSAALEEKKAELQALNGRLEEVSMACRLASAEAGIKVLRELKEAREKMGGLEKFARDEMPAYRALQQESRGRERDAVCAEAALREKRAALAATKAGLDQLVARLPGLAKQGEIAEELSSKITSFLAAPPRVVLTVNKAARLGIWAAGLALSGFVAYSGRNIGAYAAAAAIAAASAWVGLRLSIKETLVGHTAQENKAFLDGAAAEWTTVSGEKLPPEFEAARAFLAKARADAASAADSLKSRAAEYSGFEAGMRISEKTLAEIKTAAAEAAGRAAAWLKERGCGTEDNYQEARAGYTALSSRAADFLERLKIYKEKLHCSSDDEIRDRLFLEKEALDLKGIDPVQADEPELERIKARIAEKTRETGGLEAAAKELGHAMETAKAVAGARLETLPERINRAENEIFAARAEIAGLELQADAYKLAADVFGRLAGSSRMAFEALAQEVTSTLSGVVPGLRAEFGSFDAAGASMNDSAGKLRQVKNLSSGTRDLFMLAARLTMARKARLGAHGALSPALLLLDEPFYALDPARTAAALKLLGTFHAETGWQIILLTKDPSIKESAKAVSLPVSCVEL